MISLLAAALQFTAPPADIPPGYPPGWVAAPVPPTVVLPLPEDRFSPFRGDAVELWLAQSYPEAMARCSLADTPLAFVRLPEVTCLDILEQVDPAAFDAALAGEEFLLWQPGQRLPVFRQVGPEGEVPRRVRRTTNP